MLEVERTDKRCIFLIENNNFKYYIVIPFAMQVKLLLGLIDNVNNENIKEIPVLEDKVVVVPVVDDKIVNYLRTPQQSYSQALEYFSGLINNSYGLLVHNKKLVDQVVLFNNDYNYQYFINYFVEKVPGRVKKTGKNLFKVSTEVSEEIINQIADDFKYNNAEVVRDDDKVVKKGEPGFVSYVLLGVVIAILSLIFLYMLI